ncbi:MAG: YidC/Oxa1 family membrane protein insertase [bacterium]
MGSLFQILIFKPFYNGLVFLMGSLPFFDAGVIIIIFTIIVKIILLPLSIKASKAQIEMKSIEKDLNNIKEKYKDNKEEQSRKTIELYKEKNINPFSGFLILIIQLPIIIGLYQVFLKSGLPKINTAILYPFIMAPVAINMMFLNIINIADKNIILAIIAGITSYFQISYASKNQPQNTGTGTQNEIARAMTMQMKYFFPVLVIFISYSISSALSLYWITSNLFAVAQEIYIKKKYHQAVSVV